MKPLPYITAETLKDNTPVQANVENELLEGGILQGQLLVIRPLLSVALDNKLQQYLKDNKDPVNADYDALLTEIELALSGWGFYYAMPDIQIKPTNKGFMLKNTDQASQISDVNWFTMLRTDVAQKAQSFTNLLKDFLDSNQDKYPDYAAKCKKFGTENLVSGNNGGIYLD